MKILAIETSCDETAAAVVRGDGREPVSVLGEAVASSEEMHSKTGGIVPEVAAREQVKSILPVIADAAVQAINVFDKQDLRFKIQDSRIDQNLLKTINGWVRNNVDAVAVTVGPGLIGSLLVGVETAKTLAWAWKKPVIPVNHLVAHLYGSVVGDDDKGEVLEFPVLGMVVSGGHTDMVLMESHKRLRWLGGTRDDAVGECFDKCARVLGLPYPGGPAISAEAEKFQVAKSKFQIKLLHNNLPRPLLHDGSYDFSFSGLKIAVLREVEKSKKENCFNGDFVMAVAHELQEAIVEVLARKLEIAVEEFKPKSLLVAGGVAANKSLRHAVKDKFGRGGVTICLPLVKYCSDNAVMVGARAIFANSPTPVEKIQANPGLEISDINVNMD